MRKLLISITVIAMIFLAHRQQFSSKSSVNSQANNTITLNGSSSQGNSYHIGSTQLLPQPTFWDNLGRKKMNNFIWAHYNEYKLELTFVDLGYSSMLLCNFFHIQSGSISFQEKIGFSLAEDMTNMNMHIDIHKHYFDLTVRQSHSYDKETGKDITVSLFNMTLRQNDDFISFNLTHYLRDEQCFTAIRKGVISRKCYGGYGEGGALVGKTHDNPPRRFDSVYQIRPNTTRCVYDGLRGSGFYWQWVWAMASGFSKPEFYSKKNHIEKERWIGLNFGHLNQAGQDFVFINGEIYAMQGSVYRFSNNEKINSNITFRATQPKMLVTFTVLARTHFYEDMGIFKNDMIKYEGHWSGWIIQPTTNQNISFYLLAGIVETADSVF